MDLITLPIFYLQALICNPLLLPSFLFDVLLCLLPWGRPIKEWTLNQAVRMRAVTLVLHLWSSTHHGNRLSLKEGSEGNRFEIIRPRDTKLYREVLSDALIKPEPLGVTWTPARPPPPSLVKPQLTVALHFHGGGFVIGDGRDNDTGYLASVLRENMGCTHVCTPQYRLSSSKNGHYPAPFQDALTVYLDLIKVKGIPASQIIFSGDSAGANIALGLLRYLHQQGTELDLPLPGAITLWSPWVDVGGALNQDMSMSPNYRTDYLNKEFGRWGALTISGSGIADPSGPYLAPLHYPFSPAATSNMPQIPMFIHAGEREVLYDDICAFARKYESAGWLVKLFASKSSPHDILLLGPRIGFDKEAREAAEEAKAFLLGTSRFPLRA